ncbi:hypothetical protein ACS0TY_030141 [Phlomoides rotata]
MKLLRHKEWPYFVDWIDIFGKDRATGETAEEVPEAIGEMDGPNVNNPNVNNTQESNDANESGINKIQLKHKKSRRRIVHHVRERVCHDHARQTRKEDLFLISRIPG